MTVKYTAPPQMTIAEKQEQNYQNNLSQFLQDNQNYDEQETHVFDELYYLKYRIGILKKVAKEWQETADHSAGLYLDGKELINGNLVSTKVGTVANLRAAKLELIFLKEKRETFDTSQEVGAVKIEQLKKEMHSNIFVGNSFELWEYYKEVKQLTFQDRTDLRLLFELMKNDNLINETIELKHYIKWLNRFYFDGNITELKRVALKANKNVARTNDYNEYKKVTLK